VVGIGLNVNIEREALPRVSRAGYVPLHGDRKRQEREEVALALYASLERWYGTFLS